MGLEQLPLNIFVYPDPLQAYSAWIRTLEEMEEKETIWEIKNNQNPAAERVPRGKW